MPRNPVPRNPSREVGIINPRWLLDHDVPHETWNERNFAICALSCPVVKDVISQPHEKFLRPDQKEKYTPDYEVRFIDNDSLIVECKVEGLLKLNPEHQEKLKRVESLYQTEGQRFQVITKEQLAATALAPRAILLMRCGRMQFSVEDELRCLELFDAEPDGSFTVAKLVKKGISEFLVWNLVAKHRLRVPVGLNMEPTERVFLNKPMEGCYEYFCKWLGLDMDEAPQLPNSSTPVMNLWEVRYGV